MRIFIESTLTVFIGTPSACGRDQALAEELTQETFFRAMENMDGFRGQCSLFVWLCQITKNCGYSLCRKRKRQADEEMPEKSGESMEEDLFEREDASHVSAAGLVYTLR